MIVNGRTLAGEVLARTRARALALGKTPRVVAIVANETPATKSYLSIKTKRAADAGCSLEISSFGTDVSAETLKKEVLASDADAIVVQLPLPESVATQAVCDAIPFAKDADVLSRAAREKFGRGDADTLLPPVVAAVREIFKSYDVNPKGKHAVVVGDGWLVGNPCAVWLAQQGATVVTLTKKSENMSAALRAADIIISGVGIPHFITPDMLKEAKTAGGGSPDDSFGESFRGVVLIDAGTSESNGEVAGDVDPACAEKCSLFTPVPGGVGPLAVACLFENAVTLMERTTLT